MWPPAVSRKPCGPDMARFFHDRGHARACASDRATARSHTHACWPEESDEVRIQHASPSVTVRLTLHPPSLGRWSFFLSIFCPYLLLGRSPCSKSSHLQPIESAWSTRPPLSRLRISVTGDAPVLPIGTLVVGEVEWSVIIMFLDSSLSLCLPA
jgi:hypothetical protein